MTAKNKGITECRFYAAVGKMFFDCEKCGTRWWAKESGRYRCTFCKQWMVVEVKATKKNRKSAKSLLFFNSDPIWKEAINKYLEV